MMAFAPRFDFPMTAPFLAFRLAIDHPGVLESPTPLIDALQRAK
jgi:hypothetical protein